MDLSPCHVSKEVINESSPATLRLVVTITTELNNELKAEMRRLLGIIADYQQKNSELKAEKCRLLGIIADYQQKNSELLDKLAAIQAVIVSK
jgi:hypothetical protein